MKSRCAAKISVSCDQNPQRCGGAKDNRFGLFIPHFALTIYFQTSQLRVRGSMMELEMAQLDHFGLVAGVFDQLRIKRGN